MSYKKNVWTQHSQLKIKQYGLSKSKLLKLLHNPERKELGIVPGTIAVMKANKVLYSQKLKKYPGEIWLMYKDIDNIRKIISCWRYPGVSKPGEEIPIPKEIRREIMENNDF